MRFYDPCIYLYCSALTDLITNCQSEFCMVVPVWLVVFNMRNTVYVATKTGTLLCCVCDPVLSVGHKSHFLPFR